MENIIKLIVIVQATGKWKMRDKVEFWICNNVYNILITWAILFTIEVIESFGSFNLYCY